VNEIQDEALLLLGYGLFLLAAALVLERLAAHTHRRSLHFRTAGFVYHEHLDAWECPEGEHLWPSDFDRERRLVRYRARPQVCNACPLKPECTESDEGRELVRSLDPWLATEAGKFHRSISLTLAALAALLAVVGLARHHGPLELLLLGGLFLASLLLAWHMLPVVRRREASPEPAARP
jgi:hypothetical protein